MLMNMGMLMGMMVVLPLLTGLAEAISRPTQGFKDLYAEYWSETAGLANRFPQAAGTGPKLDIADGAGFGGTITFMHKGPAQNVQVGFWCNVEGERVWAGPVAVSVNEDADWTGYSVQVEGVFQRRELAECRNVETVKEIRDEGGATILSDGDADVYHVVTETQFDLPEGEEGTEYAVDTSGWYTTAPGALPLLQVADGCTVKFRVVFRHKGIPVTIRPVVHIMLGGEEYLEYVGEWQQVGYDLDWREYSQEISGVFDTGGGPTGRYLSVERSLYDTAGGVRATNRDEYVFQQVAPLGEIPSSSLDEDARYTTKLSPTESDWTPPANPTLDLTRYSYFACRASIKHKGPGGYVTFAIALRVGDYYEWAVYGPYLLGYDRDETVYYLETAPGQFMNYAGLPACRNIDVIKYVYPADRYGTITGDPIAQNGDSDVFHVAG